MTIQQAISIRKSIRTYKDEPISEELKSELKNILKMQVPFDTKQRFILIDTDITDKKVVRHLWGN